MALPLPLAAETPVKLVYNVTQTVSSTDKIFKDAASFTKKLATFEATPFLFGGIMLASAKGAGDIAQVAQGMGKLAVAASPFIFAIKILALPVLAGAAVVTASTGMVYGAEKLVDKLQKHSDADTQRGELTQHFVQRMHEFLKGFDSEEKAAAIQHPGTLISLSLLTVVFLSRTVQGDQIKDGDQMIQKNEIAKMDNRAQDYFARVCKMKTDLYDLSLSPDDKLAWRSLNESIHNFYDKKDSLTLFEQETLGRLIKECDELTKLIVEDEIFKQTWNNATGQ